MKNMVDVSGGKMTLAQVAEEIGLAMTIWHPKRLIVDIKRKEGYFTTIWISKEDFGRKK